MGRHPFVEQFIAGIWYLEKYDYLDNCTLERQENLELNSVKKQVKWNLEKPNKYLGDWLKDQGIIYIDFLPIFRQEKKENNNRYYLRFDRHLNKHGHRVIGENLHSWINKEWGL